MQMETDKSARLAEAIAEKCFGGSLPEPEIVCEAVLRAMPQIFENLSEDETQAFVNALALALRARRAVESTEWLA
jgi:hypothetical protein